MASSDRSASSRHSLEKDVEKEIPLPQEHVTPVPQPATVEELKGAAEIIPEAEITPEAVEEKWLSGVKLWLVMGPLILVFFLVLLDTTIVSTAIPDITNHFNSLADIGWYSASYQLASAVLQPLAGKTYVYFSNKWTFISFFAVFEIGSLLCGVATSSKMLIVGRAIAGMGTAGLQNGAMTIISACVPLHKRPALLGICQGFAQLGLVFGPLIGGALTQYTTWRWCFYINLPIGAVAGALLVFSRGVPDAHSKPPAMEVFRDLHHKLDLIGFVLLSPAIIMALLALQWGGNVYAWDSATIIGLFCGAAGNLLAWSAWNWWKKDDALIPVSMIRRTRVWSGSLVVGFLMSSLYIFVYYLPIYFQSADSASPTMSGVYMLPNILASLVLAVAVGKAVQIVGYYTPFSIASAIFMALGYGLCSMLSPTSTTGEWVGFQILSGIGRGMGMQMPLVAVQNGLPPAMVPLAISLCMFTGMLFGAVFLSASATIFTNSLRTFIVQLAPTADLDAILTAGATGFRKVISAEEVPGVLLAYAKSVDRVFYLCAALAALCLPFSFGLGWTNIKKKAQEKKAVAEKPDEKARIEV
ncbi:hypothetical protein LTR56_015289 [Elasticomyces elasticus]|nr:hypothetical protein LTR56_015289 [Elasticomyces elasticus]KAK3640387.1 hypothetical protein LTR22_017044 [Elasticomyces elasticus]KAK4913637.1 hypothetical protein LTR49_018051 [Elasticomyces elasticus]KAK5753064.1 hypothetical protein LTS12_016844 [Elasticomyces elasticus]